MSKSRATTNMKDTKSKEELDNELSNKFLKYIEIYLSSYSRFPENIHPEFEIRFRIFHICSCSAFTHN